MRRRIVRLLRPARRVCAHGAKHGSVCPDPAVARAVGPDLARPGAPAPPPRRSGGRPGAPGPLGPCWAPAGQAAVGPRAARAPFDHAPLAVGHARQLPGGEGLGFRLPGSRAARPPRLRRGGPPRSCPGQPRGVLWCRRCTAQPLHGCFAATAVMVSPLACTAAAAAGCTSGPACSGRLLRSAAPASARCSRPLKPDPSASLSLNLLSQSDRGRARLCRAGDLGRRVRPRLASHVHPC